jgi:hypothetical protein
MKENTILDENAIIEQALRRMRSKQPGIDGEKVKLFIALVGKEIERSGEITRKDAEELLRQLKNGEL